MAPNPYVTTREAFPTAMQRLNEFARLDRGWDTYSAEPIAPAAIDGARKLLAGVAARFAHRSERATPFFVAPLPYGGVQLEWRRPSREIEVEIGPDGTLSYLSTFGQGTSRRFDEHDIASFEEILDLIIR